MNGVGLERCPEGLGKMGTLEILDISNNKIPVLDQAAGTLFKLKVLDLKNNMIEVRCTHDEKTMRVAINGGGGCVEGEKEGETGGDVIILCSGNPGNPLDRIHKSKVRVSR